MDVLVLSRAEVERLLDPAELLDGLRRGFRDLSAGAVTAPERNELAMPDAAFLLGMPGHRAGARMTVKVVTVFERNLARGIPSHLATIGLYDPGTGACTAFMDGTAITALRTSAAAVLSADLLARRDARVAAVVGAGVQGEQHVRLLSLVRDLDEIRVASLVHADAEALAARHPRARAVRSVRDAVRGADVVALATHAAEPVIEADWVAPGAHVSSVGYRPPRGELPLGVLERGRVFVEARLAYARPPAGCAELQGRDPGEATELGELLLAPGRGRADDREVTVYKAMGHVMEDLVAAELVLAAARRDGVGTTVEL
jgi:ornithine cyclodeaminase/alanine dehydrogenase-like protein (mu-crystallin family)